MAKSLGYKDWHCSDGWYFRWKQRNGVVTGSEVKLKQSSKSVTKTDESKEANIVVSESHIRTTSDTNEADLTAEKYTVMYDNSDLINGNGTGEGVHRKEKLLAADSRCEKSVVGG